MIDVKDGCFPDGTPMDPWFFQQESALDQKIRQYCVTDHGVVPDNPGLVQTEAIQNVIETASRNGGGEVVVPAGSFRTGSLFFLPGVNLRLEKGAVLLGSENICDFQLLFTRVGGEMIAYFAAIVNADRNNDFTLSGEGTIDGCGEHYWKMLQMRRKINPQCFSLDEMRPRGLYVSNSRNARISGVCIKDAPFWSSHFYKCAKLRIEGVSFLTSDHSSPYDTDGIDLDACVDVVIRDCNFAVGVDAIALKGGKGPDAERRPENGGNFRILIEDCRFERCHTVLTCGSETLHNQNVIFRDSSVRKGCGSLLNLRMRPDTAQMSEWIMVSGISGECDRAFNAYSWAEGKRSEDLYLSYGERILLKDLNLVCKDVYSVEKCNEFFLKDIAIRDSVIRVKTTPKKMPEITLRNVRTK